MIFINFFLPKINKNAGLTPRYFIKFRPKFNKNAGLTPSNLKKEIDRSSIKMLDLPRVIFFKFLAEIYKKLPPVILSIFDRK